MQKGNDMLHVFQVAFWATVGVGVGIIAVLGAIHLVVTLCLLLVGKHGK